MNDLTVRRITYLVITLISIGWTILLYHVFIQNT